MFGFPLCLASLAPSKPGPRLAHWAQCSPPCLVSSAFRRRLQKCVFLGSCLHPPPLQWHSLNALISSCEFSQSATDFVVVLETSLGINNCCGPVSFFSVLCIAGEIHSLLVLSALWLVVYISSRNWSISFTDIFIHTSVIRDRHFAFQRL